jgi:hypothetical protein
VLRDVAVEVVPDSHTTTARIAEDQREGSRRRRGQQIGRRLPNASTLGEGGYADSLAHIVPGASKAMRFAFSETPQHPGGISRWTHSGHERARAT